MNQLIDNPVSLALGWTLLHFFWQGCLIALLTKFALNAFHARSSNVRYLIACVAFAAMALIPCLTFCSIRGGAAHIGEASELAFSSRASSDLTTKNEVTETPVELKPSNSGGPESKEASAPARPGSRIQSEPDLSVAQTVAVVSSRLRPLLLGLVVAWFVGVCLLSTRLLISWQMLRRLKTTGHKAVSNYHQRVLDELRVALGVRQVVDIAQSTLVQVPTVVGWLQPIVLLPVSAISGLDQSQLRALLAHELAHVRRADFAVNLLQTVVETLLFYHPVVWWLSARIRQERENCCDDLAVATCCDGRSYVEAMLRMEELRSVAMPFAMSSRGGSLTERVSRLLHSDSQPSTDIQSPITAALVSLLMLSLFAISATSMLPSGEIVAAEPNEPVNAAKPDARRDGDAMPETVINKVPDSVSTHTISIIGKASDATGKPIAGATIYVASHAEFYKLLKTTTTDKNGMYAFRDLELPIKRADSEAYLDSGRFEVYGTANGYAFAWRSQKSYHPDLGSNTIENRDSPDGPGHFVGDEEIRLDLAFVRPAPLSGTIVDDNNKPIPDTKVHLFNCWRAPTEKFSDLNMAQFDMSSLYSDSYCPAEISTVRTNANGEFSFSNAPPECRYRMSIKPPGFARRMMYATTQSNPDIDVDQSRKTFHKGSKLERDGMQLMFEAPRQVRIQLVGLADPKYGDGALVSLYNREAGATGRSDEIGVASMKIPPGEYKVEILPPIDTPYWTTEREITVTEDQKQSFELEMTPAAVVDIQVIDASGDSVEGAEGFDLWVENELDDGRKQRDIHFFRNYERDTRVCHVHRVRTDAKGKMRANFLPGKYRIGIGRYARPDGWKVVDNNGKEVELTIGEPTKVEICVRPPSNP